MWHARKWRPWTNLHVRRWGKRVCCKNSHDCQKYPQPCDKTTASTCNKYHVSMNYLLQTLAFITLREYFTEQFYIYPGRYLTLPIYCVVNSQNLQPHKEPRTKTFSRPPCAGSLCLRSDENACFRHRKLILCSRHVSCTWTSAGRLRNCCIRVMLISFNFTDQIRKYRRFQKTQYSVIVLRISRCTYELW